MPGTDLLPVAGAKIYIGSVVATKAADFIASDFTTQSWILIDGLKTMGRIGDSKALITTSLVNRGRDVKQGGTFNGGSMQNSFAIIPGDAGQAALIAASKTRNNYAFKIDWGDAPAVDSDPVTITIASPGVVTDTAHGLVVNDPVVFTTTGALPTGLTASTTYFVKTVLDANSYTVSATAGGTVIATTGTQSGVHTRTTAPTSSQTLFIGIVMGAERDNGEANTIRMLNATVEVNSNQVDVATTQ